MHFIPKEKVADKSYNSLPLPYADNLSKMSNVVKNRKQGFNITFQYPNTLRKNIVHNNPKKSEDVGVYVIGCRDCDKCYIGESGRSTEQRKKEHIAACRNGNVYSALARHS